MQQQQLHQQMMGIPSNYLNMQGHQRQLSQHTKFPQNVNTQDQGTFISEGRQDNRQSHSSMVSNEMKQEEESHKVLPENSSDFAASNVLTNSSDWRDQAYEQLQFVKEAHLAELMKIYKEAQEKSLQLAIAERRDIYEKTRLFLEKIVMFLQTPKADFFQQSQKEVDQAMWMIMRYTRKLKDGNPQLQHHQPLQQSSGQLQMGQLQQRGGENLQANIPRQDMTSTLVASPQLSTQRRPINLQALVTNSFQQGTLTRKERAELSSLPRRTTLPGSSEQSHVEEESSAEIPGFNYLLEMVQSVSAEALVSATKDMMMVSNLADLRPGTFPYGGCREYIIDNSRYHWRYDEKEGVFLPHYGDPSDTKIKLHLSAMVPDGLTSPAPSCVRDDCSSGLTSDIESSPACTIKRQKTKLSDLLLQEVKEINQKLVETVLSIKHCPDADKVIIVRFSYRAVGQSLSMLPELVLQVFVADDYPYSSPCVLDPSPDMFRDNEEHKAIWENTRSKFNRSLRICSQLISLKNMARTWDKSARDAILEFAMKKGGGCFTSTYGGWEDVTST